MKAALRWLGALLIALSIGTFVSVLVILAMLWMKGALTDERLYAMLAALKGIEPATSTQQVSLDPDAEQPSLQQVLAARTVASLDLDLRENAIDKTLGDLRTLERQLQTESQRLDTWKESFDKRLSDLQKAATEDALLEVQRTLEAIAPKQAKEQLMKMLADEKTPSDDPVEDIVRILKAMPLDKRRKILAEFKTPEEVEKFHEILRVIRVGGTDVQLLRETRAQLQQQGSQ